MMEKSKQDLVQRFAFVTTSSGVLSIALYVVDPRVTGKGKKKDWVACTAVTKKMMEHYPLYPSSGLLSNRSFKYFKFVEPVNVFYATAEDIKVWFTLRAERDAYEKIIKNLRAEQKSIFFELQSRLLLREQIVRNKETKV